MDNNWQYKDRNANGICDSYAHIAAMIPNSYTYQWLCVESMNALRNANNYRPKLYCLPDQTVWQPIGTNGLPPFQDYYTQVRMIPGTIIVGMSLTVANDFAGWATTPFNKQNNFYVDVTDDGTGIPFFTGWVAETQFIAPCLYNDASGVTSRQTYNGKFPWFPLTKARPVSDPGIVSVGMCAKYEPSTDSPIAPQLILICCEPCNVFRGVGGCQ